MKSNNRTKSATDSGASRNVAGHNARSAQTKKRAVMNSRTTPRSAPQPANQHGSVAKAKRTKLQTCIDLLSRRGGASIEDLRQATGWQTHSVRGFLAGAVKKKLGLTLVSEKTPDLPRNYRILAVGG